MGESRFTFGLPGRDAGGESPERTRSQRTGDPEEALDEEAFLESVEADLGHPEHRRKIRGIIKGVAIGVLLWVLLIAVVVIATR